MYYYMSVLFIKLYLFSVIYVQNDINDILSVFKYTCCYNAFVVVVIVIIIIVIVSAINLLL